ncbi:hypothetical protein SLEP1_g44050 [Rubroshorea leprosula]|uniref:Secreted protein n=1 Tax=Rubroshorea leprosula TaxID=152421 RepID=A0AAV5LF04_9ROSI|nr:hypothetical protein SLEP1_g44050 [Rubroshorea leprosula]
MALRIMGLLPSLLFMTLLYFKVSINNYLIKIMYCRYSIYCINKEQWTENLEKIFLNSNRLIYVKKYKFYYF